MLDAPDIILRNARVFGAGSAVTAVAVANGVILATGRGAGIMCTAGPGTEVIDCSGGTVIPGIVDEHIHLFGAASARAAVDCRLTATPTVAAVVDALRASSPRADGWIRGNGYDDSPVGLGRHLTRYDLDGVSGSFPVRVDHRSGHATVLNSAALALAGITAGTGDPPGGAIIRDAHGEPTGLLLDMDDWLRQRIGSRAETGELRSAVRGVVQELLRYGVTGITDAGADNGIKRWQAFQSLAAGGVIPLRVTMMAGARRLDEFRNAGLKYGAECRNAFLTLGHAKIMLTASSGGLQPDFDALSNMVRTAHDSGFPVAIHAVEREAVVASALAIADHPSPVGQDRIEHCAECPPDVAETVASSGAKAVLNTGFLYYDGERYRQTVSEDLLPHLYPAGALDDLGVPVAVGSDAPVIEPNPWAALAAAVQRHTSKGNKIGGLGLPSVAAALHKHVGGNRVIPNQPADLTLVEPDPFAIPVENLPEIRSVLTLVDGRVVWRDGV